MLLGIKLIIFDLDGVLVDSREAIVEAFNLILHELGEPPQPFQVIEAMIGETLYDMFRKTLPPSKHDKIQWCFERFPQIYSIIAPKKTKVLPGVVDTLEYFKDKGVKMSIATTKRSYVARELLTSLGIINYFDLVLGINDVPAPKPSPDIIHMTLNKMGIKATEAVFIEDTTIGLEAGKKAEVKTIGITTGTHDKAKLLTLKPDAIIDNPTELKKIIIL
jgi:HAD superfamily hydrolase (TIGR01509 family)